MFLLLLFLFGLFLYHSQGIEAVYGLGLAAFFSLVMYLAAKGSKWSGTIVDLAEKTSVSHYEDHTTHTETYLVAHVKLDSGRIKKVRAANHWRIGDRIVKQRGARDVEINP